MVERLSFEDQISKNKWRSTLLISVILIAFVVLGFVISLAVEPGYFFIIMILSIVFSLGYVLISYYNAEKIALAAVKAEEASRTEYRSLYHAVEGMALASGLTQPKVYVMKSPQINAFASGRDPEHAVICVTTGCVEKLNKQELEGVIAHEMSHIANYDIRFMTLVTVLVGVISIIAEIYLRSLWFSNNDRDSKEGIIFVVLAIVVAILAPILAQLASLAISRKREFAADATAVKFTRYSPGLKSALEKIKSEYVLVDKEDSKHYASALAPLFISDPFKKGFQNMLSTHPDIDERISRLSAM